MSRSSCPRCPICRTTLPAVAVDRLHLDRIELGAPVLGEAAVFTLAGRAGTVADGERVEAQLDLRRIDEATASLRLDAALDLRAVRLKIDAIAEETGGLVGGLAGRPGAGPFKLTLQGDGPLAQWQGRLRAGADGLFDLATELELAYAERKQLGLTGTLDVAPGVLPPDVGKVVGPRVELAVQAGEPAPGRLSLERLEVRAAAASLTGQGQADLAADRLAGAIRLDVPSLERFAGLAATPLSGRLAVSLDADGAAGDPSLRLALTGQDILAATARLPRLEGAFDVGFLGPLSEGYRGVGGYGRHPGQRSRHRRQAARPGRARRSGARRQGTRRRPGRARAARPHD